MPTVLQQPVELGALCLAPTTELAGLAALARTSDYAEQLRLLVELAAAVRAEDAERDRMIQLRISGLLAPLPRRSVRR
jgi:hypothetical protein